MNDWLVRHLLLYGADAVSIFITLVAFRRHVPRRGSWIRWAAALLGMVFIGRTIYFFHTNDGPQRAVRGIPSDSSALFFFASLADPRTAQRNVSHSLRHGRNCRRRFL
jgi:hypothetical protein